MRKIKENSIICLPKAQVLSNSADHYGPLISKFENPSRIISIIPHLYTSNHNFTIIEDFDETANLDGIFFKIKQEAELPSIIGKNTALASIKNYWAEQAERCGYGLPHWGGESGSLLTCVNMWIVPLSSLDEGGKSIDSCIEKIKDIYRELTNQDHRFPVISNELTEGEDFLLSKILDGKACLATDLRYYGEDLGTRVLLVHNDLPREQIGRAVRKLTDIATYRIIALRDYKYSEPLYEQLNNLGTELNIEISKLGKIDLKRVSSQHEIDMLIERRQEALQTIHKLAQTLARFNWLMGDGVTGKALSAENYSKLIQERIDSLREESIPGYQTLATFLGRFESSVHFMKRISERYNALKRRIGESAAVIRTDLDMLQLNQIGINEKTQTRLQKTLEDLTIFAVTYYLGQMIFYTIGKFLMKKGLIFPNDEIFVRFVSFLIAAFFIWWFTNVRKRD